MYSVEPLAVLAVFRHVIRGAPSHYVTVAKRYVPSVWRRVTVTVVVPESWKTGRPLYGHLVKELGATIHNSYKIVINMGLMEQLGLLGRRGPVWVRIMEYTPEPPPPPARPYIQRPATVLYDGASYFLTMSTRAVDLLREVSPGRNLRVTVYVGERPATYVKRPITARSGSERMCKILLPAGLFGDTLRGGEVVVVRIETTDEPETRTWCGRVRRPDRV